MAALAWLVLGAATAGFVQGLAGFAFGLTAMSFWAWSLSPKLAGPLVVVCSLVGQCLSIRSARRGFDLRLVLPFIVGGALGIPIGTALIPHMDQAVFKFCVGLFLVVWCPVMLFARNLPVIQAGGRLADGSAGLIGGVMAGLAGIPGPVPTLWCALRGWDRHRQRAAFQSFFIAMHALTLVSYLVSGLVTREAMRSFAIAIPAMLVPTLLGARLYAKVDETLFRRLVMSILLVSGIGLVISSAPKLVGA